MTLNEFHHLKINDRLHRTWPRDTFVIKSVEFDYDYSTQPPTRYVWQAHSTNGVSFQETDPLDQLELEKWA